MGGVEYRYELRHGDEIFATGHLVHEPALEPGDRVEIGGRSGVVRKIEPRLGQSELDLLVELEDL